MWWLGFVFHEMSFGLLSIFIPLYVVAIGGSLIQVGVISSTALLVAIPASFLWGYLCDRSRHYKPCILLSFLFLAVILYALTFTADISLIIALYALMAFFHMAHEVPKNVLIAETYTRRKWVKSYALYEEVTELGWLIGTLIGLYMSSQGLSASSILLACSGLNLAAFITSIFLISDPAFIFERNLVRVERSVLRTYRRVAALRIMDSGHINVHKMLLAREEKHGFFCLGLAAFFMATKILFTPLPIFLSRNCALQQDMIYALFCLNSAGGFIGYFLMNRLSLSLGKRTLYKIATLRGVLSFLLIAVRFTSEYGVTLIAAILFLLGLAYTVFHILSLSLSMEILPEKMAGIFNVIAGLGEASGSFMGSFIAEKLGFMYLFLGAGLTFFTSCVILKMAM